MKRRRNSRKKPVSERRPTAADEKKLKQAEKRNLLSSFFITLLIGGAYQEMVTAVRDSSRADGLSIETVCLATIFFFTSMRFFIGNQLHLLSDSLLRLPGLLWLYDLLAIIAQSVALIFLGGVCSLKANKVFTVGFLELLIILYVLDIAWILSQWVLGSIFDNWKREFIPWSWAALNSILVAGMLGLNAIVDLYTVEGILALLGLNIVGFIVDVVLVNYHDAL